MIFCGFSCIFASFIFLRSNSLHYRNRAPINVYKRPIAPNPAPDIDRSAYLPTRAQTRSSRSHGNVSPKRSGLRRFLRNRTRECRFSYAPHVSEQRWPARPAGTEKSFNFYKFASTGCHVALRRFEGAAMSANGFKFSTPSIRHLAGRMSLGQR